MATISQQQSSPDILQGERANNIARARRQLIAKFGITALAIALASIWLMPLFYGGVTSLKTKEQISDPTAPILPAKAQSFEFEGEEYDVYTVPFA